MGSDCQLNIKVFCFNPFRENSYVLWRGPEDCVVVDPGCYGKEEGARLLDYLASEGLKPSAVWLTHGHFDHVFGVAGLCRSFPVPVYMSPEDKVMVEYGGMMAESVGMPAPDVSFGTVDISDGQELGLGFKVIATPGHTPGSVCFYSEESKVLLSGDTLFAGSIGRTDLNGGDYDREIVSIMDGLMGLPGDVDVLPGHGPATSISVERTQNPFLQPWGGPCEDENEMI